MNSKLAIVAVFLSFLLIGVVIAAIYQFTIPQQAGTVNFAITIDDVPRTNGQMLDWGILTPSTEYNKTMAITNLGTVSLTITISFEPRPLPIGWTEIWHTPTNIIPAGNTLEGNLSLTTGSSIAGTYTWDMVITGTG